MAEPVEGRELWDPATSHILLHLAVGGWAANLLPPSHTHTKKTEENTHSRKQRHNSEVKTSHVKNGETRKIVGHQ